MTVEQPQVTEIGTVATIVTGSTPARNKPEYFGGHIPFVRPLDLDGGDVLVSATEGLTAAGAERSRVVPANTVLVSCIGVLGKTALLGTQGAFNQQINGILPSERLLPRYVLAWARTLGPWLKQNASATTVSIVNKSRFSRAPIPVFPLETQHRIVAHLDAIHERTRAARAALEAIPPLVETFRQSVLAAAFRGDLTADWRAQHPDVEPASVLLERIRVERRERWIEDYAEKHRARAEKRAAKAGKPWTAADDEKKRTEGWKKGVAKYVEPEPVDAEAEGLPALPETWCWARLEELVPADAPIVYGIIQPGPNVGDGVPYIRPADIDDGEVDFGSLRRTSPEIAANYERARLRHGDLVYSIVGTIGKHYVVRNELDGANITQSSVRIRPLPGFSADELLLALSSPIVQRQISVAQFGNAVQRLNVAHVRELIIPVPSGAERLVLTALVSRVLGSLSTRVAAAHTDLDRLATVERAALAKAFRGERVP